MEREQFLGVEPVYVTAHTTAPEGGDSSTTEVRIWKENGRQAEGGTAVLRALPAGILTVRAPRSEGAAQAPQALDFSLLKVLPCWPPSDAVAPDRPTRARQR